MDNLKQKEQDTSTWIKKFFDYLESILEKYVQQFKDHEELAAFMKDENNLYNEDGTLTTAPLHNDFLSAGEAQRIQLLMRMNFPTMHLYRLSRHDRNRIPRHGDHR